MFYTENDYIAGKKLKLQRFGIQPIGLLKKLLIRIISIGFFFTKKKQGYICDTLVTRRCCINNCIHSR